MRPVVLTVVDLVVVAEVRARLEPAPAVGDLRLHEPIVVADFGVKVARLEAA
jgi:hypothetical protein